MRPAQKVQRQRSRKEATTNRQSAAQSSEDTSGAVPDVAAAAATPALPSPAASSTAARTSPSPALHSPAVGYIRWSGRQRRPRRLYDPVAEASKPQLASSSSKVHGAGDAGCDRDGSSVEEEQQSALFVGATIQKHFDGHGLFKGTVTGHDAKQGLWKVVYEDDDTEEMTTGEITPLVVVSS